MTPHLLVIDHGTGGFVLLPTGERPVAPVHRPTCLDTSAPGAGAGESGGR